MRCRVRGRGIVDSDCVGRCRRDGIENAGRKDHGAAEPRHTRSGAIAAGTQQDAAGRCRHGRCHVDVTHGGRTRASGGCRNGGIQVDIAPGDRYQVSRRGGNGGIHVHVVERVQRQRCRGAGRGPRDRFIDVDIAVHATMGAVAAENGDARCNQLAAKGGASDVGACGDREVNRIDQPAAARSLCRLRRDGNVVGYFDLRGRGFDKAAIAAVGRRGVERAADMDGAALHVAHQADRAVVVLQRLCLDHAGVVDRALKQGAGRLRRQQDLAAVGLDQAAVLRQRTERTLAHADIEQAVTRDVERHGVAGGQRDAAEPGLDHAVVGDAGAEQGHIAAIGIDRTLIEHGCRAVAGKLVAAGHEVTVRDIERGGH